MITDNKVFLKVIFKQRLTMGWNLSRMSILLSMHKHFLKSLIGWFFFSVVLALDHVVAKNIYKVKNTSSGIIKSELVFLLHKYFLQKVKVWDQAKFCYEQEQTTTCDFFRIFEKNYNDWIKSFPKSKWTGLRALSIWFGTDDI